jgi:hypothetical protein
MTVKTSRLLSALLVLGVLFASQAAYVVSAHERPSGHCAAKMPAEQPCRLPLWLSCCDEHAAVSAGAASVSPSGALALPLSTALVPAGLSIHIQLAAHVAIPPDTPPSRSAILLI